MNLDPAARPYFYTLAGMRGIAALLIVTFHAAPLLGIQLDPLGFAGVDLFFLLSGLVIETAYGDRLRRGMRGSAFLQARFFRLYPLYALSILTMLLAIGLSSTHGIFINASATQIQIPHFWQIAAMSLVGLPIWNVRDMYPLNQPAWSLFFEVMANFIWLALLPRLTNRLLMLIVLLGFLGLVCDIFHPLDNHMLDGMSRVGFSFFLGVLMARNPPARSGTLLGSGSLLLICGLLLCARSAAFGSIIWFGLVTVAFPFLVRAAMTVQPSGRLLKVCCVLGDLSYPLYIMQTAIPPLIFYSLASKFHLDIAETPPWSGLGLIVISCGISWGAYVCFDAPLRVRLSRHSRILPSPAVLPVIFSAKPKLSKLRQ